MRKSLVLLILLSICLGSITGIVYAGIIKENHDWDYYPHAPEIYVAAHVKGEDVGDYFAWTAHWSEEGATSAGTYTAEYYPKTIYLWVDAQDRIYRAGTGKGATVYPDNYPLSAYAEINARD